MLYIYNLIELSKIRFAFCATFPRSVVPTVTTVDRIHINFRRKVSWCMGFS